MAQQPLDPQGNESYSTHIGKLVKMFTELYSQFTGGQTPALTTFTTTGNGTVGGALAVTGNETVGGTLAVTGASTYTGLAVANGGVQLDSTSKTASATSGAATLSKMAGVITSEALTTAAGAAYTLTLTNTKIAAADQVFASVALGTSTNGVPVVSSVKPAAGSVAIIVQNVDLAAALNGTIKVSFAVFKN